MKLFYDRAGHINKDQLRFEDYQRRAETLEYVLYLSLSLKHWRPVIHLEENMETSEDVIRE